MSARSIRCVVCGVILKDAREAQQHADLTGHANFEESEEAVLQMVCQECGKPCRSLTEQDLHTKRTGHCKYIDKTTMDTSLDTESDMKTLSAEVKVKLQAEMKGEELDNEELAARVAAQQMKGKQQGSSSSAAAVISEESLKQLVEEMGFSETRAKKALVRTDNMGAEAAANWLAEHLEDADIDEELKVEPNVMSEADIVAAAEAKKLTPEEKKRKLDEVLQKAKEKKEKEEKENEKQRERVRREGGKKMVQTKKEFEDLQRKRDMEARKKEKEEYAKERERIRAEMEAEKAARMANRPGRAAAQIATPTPAAQPAPVPAAQESPKPKVAPKISWEEAPATLEQSLLRICDKNRDFRVKPAVDLMGKLVANIQKNPAEPKFRRVRLSNQKIKDALCECMGARQFLVASGWRHVEVEFIEFPMEADLAVFVANFGALTKEIHTREEAKKEEAYQKQKTEAAERLRVQKEEKEKIRKQMELDRANVSARGPAGSSVAKSLPQGSKTVGRLAHEEEDQRR